MTNYEKFDVFGSIYAALALIWLIALTFGRAKEDDLIYKVRREARELVDEMLERADLEMTAERAQEAVKALGMIVKESNGYGWDETSVTVSCVEFDFTTTSTGGQYKALKTACTEALHIYQVAAKAKAA